jgi:hypothetical protein
MTGKMLLLPLSSGSARTGHEHCAAAVLDLAPNLID